MWLKKAGFEIGTVTRVQVEPVLETDSPYEVDPDLEAGAPPVSAPRSGWRREEIKTRGWGNSISVR
jgi:hypothetical protein